MSIIGAFMVPHPPLIVAEVGRGEEKAIFKTIRAYEEVAGRIEALEPETIVVTSPHSILYADYFHISPGKGARGDFGQFRAGQTWLEAEYDTELVAALCQAADEHQLMAGTLGEQEKQLDHGTMVPLYFVNQKYTSYKLVRIGLSGLPLTDHYKLGQLIKQASQQLGRKTVIIASGDLSHKLTEDGPYGYQPEGPKYDEAIMSTMKNASFGELFDFPEVFCEKAAECGHRSFVIMAGALDCTKVEAEELSYEGPFGVGYGICAYKVLGEDSRRNFEVQYEKQQKREAAERKRSEDAYVQLARKSLEAYVTKGERISIPEEIPAEMERPAGAFVSLKMDGKLRGCIGTIGPVQPSIAEEIIENAISAATRDPRFQPVGEEELERLEYSVDILSESESIASAAELDVERYGVIVTKGGKRGLLLPNLEGIDTVEEQIAIAKQKAGIDPSETVVLERFEVVRHR